MWVQAYNNNVIILYYREVFQCERNLNKKVLLVFCHIVKINYVAIRLKPVCSRQTVDRSPPPPDPSQQAINPSPLTFRAHSSPAEIIIFSFTPTPSALLLVCVGLHFMSLVVPVTVSFPNRINSYGNIILLLYYYNTEHFFRFVLCCARRPGRSLRRDLAPTSLYNMIIIYYYYQYMKICS